VLEHGVEHAAVDRIEIDVDTLRAGLGEIGGEIGARPVRPELVDCSNPVPTSGRPQIPTRCG
jgi:hypothetical protein